MARVTAVAGTKILETDIDLAGKSIAGITERTGIEAPLTVSELIAAGDIALKNPEFLAALQKRGFSEPKKLNCAPFSAGNYGIREHEGKRLLKVGCFDASRSTTNMFGWPIEQLYALVELREKRVLKVIDEGIVPMAEQDMNFTEAAIKPLRSRATRSSRRHRKALTSRSMAAKSAGATGVSMSAWKAARAR